MITFTFAIFFERWRYFIKIYQHNTDIIIVFATVRARTTTTAAATGSQGRFAPTAAHAIAAHPHRRDAMLCRGPDAAAAAAAEERAVCPAHRGVTGGRRGGVCEGRARRPPESRPRRRIAAETPPRTRRTQSCVPNRTADDERSLARAPTTHTAHAAQSRDAHPRTRIIFARTHRRGRVTRLIASARGPFPPSRPARTSPRYPRGFGDRCCCFVYSVFFFFPFSSPVFRRFRRAGFSPVFRSPAEDEHPANVRASTFDSSPRTVPYAAPPEIRPAVHLQLLYTVHCSSAAPRTT